MSKSETSHCELFASQGLVSFDVVIGESSILINASISCLSNFVGLSSPVLDILVGDLFGRYIISAANIAGISFDLRP